MKILLSIKPDFVKKISEGSKRFEFRRVVYRRQEVRTIVVYSSRPVCRLVGEIEVENILSENLRSLWNHTKSSAGISKECFNNYFAGKDLGYAIKIKAYHPYERPIALQEKYPGITPPQSFCYVDS